jgi:hypothetical protein
MLTLTIPALRPAPSRVSPPRRRELARGLACRLDRQGKKYPDGIRGRWDTLNIP